MNVSMIFGQARISGGNIMTWNFSLWKRILQESDELEHCFAGKE
jgi:hypothetical protein